jgi:hypothetical protein
LENRVTLFFLHGLAYALIASMPEKRDLTHHVHKYSGHLLHGLVIHAACLVLVAMLVAFIPAGDAGAALTYKVFEGKITAATNCNCPYSLGTSITVSGKGAGTYFLKAYDPVAANPYEHPAPQKGQLVQSRAFRNQKMDCFVFSAEKGCEKLAAGGMIVDKSRYKLFDE